MIEVDIPWLARYADMLVILQRQHMHALVQKSNDQKPGKTTYSCALFPPPTTNTLRVPLPAFPLSLPLSPQPPTISPNRLQDSEACTTGPSNLPREVEGGQRGDSGGGMFGLLLPCIRGG